MTEPLDAIRPSPTVRHPHPSSTPPGQSLVDGRNEYKYLSLGPNIYGKVKTHFQTYTYFTTGPAGAVKESREVITQVS